jgi:hypothetical protein
MAALRAMQNLKTKSRDGVPTFRDLMALVCAYLYTPDGKPSAGWSEARDGSILKELLKHHVARDIAIAIEGLAILRDFPGVYADAIDWPFWPKPGQKTDLRALYNNRSGVVPVFTLATQAYWKRENSRSKNTKDGTIERIGQILKRAIEKAP